ncbi:MAG: hypothetical protein RR552_05315 [Oscillospiraceae bacterium]
MYRTFRFATEIVLKSKLLFILLVLQLAFLMFFTLNYAFATSQLSYPERILKDTTDTSYTYFSPILYDLYNINNNTDIKITKSPYADFDKLNGLKAVENVYTVFDGKNPKELRAYPKLLTEKLKIPMRKGVWLSEAKDSTEEGVINCVTSNNSRKINEIISFDEINNKLSIKLKVVGIADEPYFRFNQNYGGEKDLVLSGVFTATQKNETIANKYEILWADDEQILAPLRKTETTCPNRLLFFNEISDVQREENLKILKESGGVLTTDLAADDVGKSMYIKEELPMVLCVWIISLIGFCCATIIFIQNAEHCFTVFEICGASRRQNIMACIAVSMMIVAFAALPYVFLVPIAGIFNVFRWTYSFISLGFYIISGCVLLFFALSALMTFITFKSRKSSIV